MTSLYSIVRYFFVSFFKFKYNDPLSTDRLFLCMTYEDWYPIKPFLFWYFCLFSRHQRSPILLPSYLSTSSHLKITSRSWDILWYYHLCIIMCKQFWVFYILRFSFGITFDPWDSLLVHSYIQVTIVYTGRQCPVTITSSIRTHPVPPVLFREFKKTLGFWRVFLSDRCGLVFLRKIETFEGGDFGIEVTLTLVLFEDLRVRCYMDWNPKRCHVTSSASGVWYGLVMRNLSSFSSF